jgi:excisionase family DNA binding protein
MKLLDIKETGERLGLSRWTIAEMLESGALPGIILKSGRRKKIWRIREDILEKWIEARELETRKMISGERKLQAV